MLPEPLALQDSTADTLRSVFLRSAGSGFVAFLVGIVCGPPLLRCLRRLKIGEKTEKTASATLAEQHRSKSGTPTMGGLLLLPSLLAAMGIFGNFGNHYVLLAFLGVVGFCLIGFIDDYIKLRYPSRHGLTTITKLLLQCLVSLALSVALWTVMKARDAEHLLSLHVPFTDWSLDLSGAYGLPFLLCSTLVMVGTSNGVNLADGMDGLAPGCVVLAAAAFAAIAFAVGRPDYAEYLSVPYVRGAQEMVIVASALVGTSAAFLWYNAFPAQVFLGDTGSLALGGLLGYIAIVSKQELVLPLVGGVFVVESLSVMLQVGSYKLRRKRIFRCAPLHHHFQFGGMHEAKIVVRFWIAGAACAVLGLATLKFP